MENAKQIKEQEAAEAIARHATPEHHYEPPRVHELHRAGHLGHLLTMKSVPGNPFIKTTGVQAGQMAQDEKIHHPYKPDTDPPSTEPQSGELAA